MNTEDRILANFILETEDTIKELSEKVAILESSPADKGTLDSMLRILHTMKGNASIFSLTNLKVIAHTLEDLLAGRKAARCIDSDKDFFALLLEGVKHINNNVMFVKSKNIPERPDPVEQEFVVKINEKLSYYKVIQQLSECKYRANDTVRYFYKDIDVTRPVFVIQGFFEKASLESSPGEIDDKFITAVNQLSEIFRQNGDKKHADIAKKMGSDLDAMLDDSKIPSVFLSELLENSFQEILSVLRKTDLKGVTPAVGIDKQAVIEEQQFKLTFRVEEERIEEMLKGVHKLGNVEEAFGRVRNSLVKAGVAPEVILEYQKMLNELEFVSRDIMRMLIRIKVTSPSLLFEKLEKLTSSLAESFNKKIRLETKGNNIFVDRGKIEVLERILLHIVRNSIDHGIESPQERIKNGKPEEGLISITASESADNLIISVSDDGRGIDFKSLREAALKKGKITAEEYAMLDDNNSDRLLFISGLSTKDSVTEFSGRGIGLDVVSQTLKEVKGTIKASSVLGKGAAFVITLPIAKSHSNISVNVNK